MFAIVIGILVFIGVMLVFLGLSSSGQSGGISARLERYAAGKPEATPTASSQGSSGLSNALAQSVALARLNRVVEQRDFGANLSRDIARADLKLRPSEYMVIWGGSIVGVPFLFLMLSVVLAPLGSGIALVIGAVIGFFLPRMWLSRRRASRLNAFNKQLPDTITLIANALRAGSSFLQAIEMVVRESTPPVG